MDAKQALKIGIDLADYVTECYLADLSDEDLLHRPAPGANHLNWQLGHLISAERLHMEMVSPGSSPSLPEGFETRYSKESATCDDPAKFHSKDELLSLYHKQRAATLAALAAFPEAEFERETGIAYAPTAAALFSMQGSHWMMHAGQWAVIRRQLGRPPLF